MSAHGFSLTRPLLRGAASLARGQLSRRHKALGRGHAAQASALASLVDGYSRCQDGASFGLTPASTTRDFLRRVPLRTYEGFDPLVSLMLRGDSDVLWPGRCDHFAVSSGTTAGRTKYLPVNAAMLAHFRRTGLESLLQAAGSCGMELFNGRHLFLGGATALEPLRRAQGFPVGFTGDLSGITALNMPAWAEKLLYEPGLETASIPDWPRKIEAIARRCAHRPISMIAGIPSWTLVLAEALRRVAAAEGLPCATLRDLWPELRCFVHGGVPLAPYVDELRATLGEGISFHEVYPASEGFIAAQDGAADEGLRLFCDAGIYYEFVPFSEYDEARLPALAEHAVPLEGVRTGVDYVLVMSTPAGLSRYIIGDVVRFLSTDEPRLVYSGRTRLQLSAFGEHVIERELTATLAACVSSRQLQVADFHVAPVFVDQSAGVARGCHEWWIALRSECPGLDPNALARELDAELARRNDDYAAKRVGGGLDLPEVRLVAPSVFSEWQKRSGKWGGQNKMPRCRSDRAIADGLSDIAGVRGRAVAKV